MWIGDEYYGTIIQIGNQQLLIFSAVATAAALSLWILRGRAWDWIRCLVLCATSIFLLQMGAGELVLYLCGSLASIALCLRLLRRVDPQPFTPDSTDAMALTATVCIGFILALREPGVFRTTWFVLGASTGCGAAVIDIAARAERRWFLKLALATGFAVLFVSLVATLMRARDVLGLIDMLEIDDSMGTMYAGRFSIGVTGLSMLLFGIWRLLMRLAVVHPLPNSERSYWPQLGVGYRRVVRLLLVWPPLIAISVFMFSLWFEVYCRMPTVAAKPPVVLANDAYRDLMNVAERIAWPAELTGGWSSLSEENVSDLVASNREVLTELGPLLERPIVVPIDYSPLARSLSNSQFINLCNCAGLLIAHYADGASNSDSDAQYEAVRLLLLLGKPLHQSHLLKHEVFGQSFEEMAYYLAYVSRDQFTSEQYRELITLLNESSTWSPPSEVVGATFLDWQLVTRGWREGVNRATAPPFDVTDSHGEYEMEHACLRGTLICEFALQQYQNDQSQSASRLEDLVPSYLDALPIDPFSKQPFAYHVADDADPRSFVCSVGYDRIRDDLSREPFSRGNDISIAKSVWDEDNFHPIDPLPNFDLPWELDEMPYEQPSESNSDASESENSTSPEIEPNTPAE
jgi:hypothetical protein